MSHDTDLLLIDGVCTLCEGAVRFILDHERPDARPLRFAALQSDAAAPILDRAGLAPDFLDGAVYVRTNGEVLTGADAALAAMQRLRGPWPRLAAIGRRVPRALRDAVYGLVARSRYRVFGKKDVCGLPSRTERARMLA